MKLIFRWHHKKPLIASRSLSGFLIYIPTTKCRTIKYSEDYSNKATYSAHYTRIYKWTITVKGICKGYSTAGLQWHCISPTIRPIAP